MEASSEQKKGKNLTLLRELEPRESGADQLPDRERELAQAAAIIRVGLSVLSGRVLSLIALVVASSLFAYAVWSPSALALGSAIGFALVIFLPILYADFSR